MILSIAMCTYNGANYLREQLDSFSRQTRLPDELVICDDCSKDETAEIVKKFAAESLFPVHFYVNETNLGTTKNFEKAIEASRGDIIFLSDQDDIWLPEKLRKFEAAFERDAEVGLFFCDAELVDKDLKSLNLNNWDALEFTSEQREKILTGSFTILLYRNVITGCTMAFRAEFKDIILPIPEYLYNVIHDYWLAIVLSSVCKIGLIDEPLVKYRQHPAQQIGTRKDLQAIAGSDSKSNTGRFSPKHLVEKFGRIYSFEDLCKRLERLETVHSRLVAADKNFYRDSIDELARHIMHLRSRTKIRKRKLLRVPLIIRELTSLRYKRYSSGAASALKDLFYI